MVRYLIFSVAVGVVATLGCGDRGGRSVIEGRVTWEGKPVPAGQVVFEPDPERGGKGPAGVATIQDGHFRTNPEFGAVAGPHIARFRFGDGKGVSDMQPFGRQICPEFTESVDLEGRGTTINFDMPLKK